MISRKRFHEKTPPPALRRSPPLSEEAHTQQKRRTSQKTFSAFSFLRLRPAAYSAARPHLYQPRPWQVWPRRHSFLPALRRPLLGVHFIECAEIPCNILEETVVLTTLSKLVPAASRTAFRFAMTCLDCPTMSAASTLPVAGLMAI